MYTIVSLIFVGVSALVGAVAISYALADVAKELRGIRRIYQQQSQKVERELDLLASDRYPVEGE